MTLEERLTALEAKVAGMARAPAASSGGAVASDYEMSGEHGDPTIRKDPPRWVGESMVGMRYSQCPADYLESLAGFLEWKAGKTEQEGDAARQKFVAYDRKDAARARGWAARAKAAPVAQEGGGDDDQSIPF